MPVVPSKRAQLEGRLKEVVLALRADQDFGNITVQMPETGDFVAILRVGPEEAKDLQAMLSTRRGGQ